MEVSLKYTGNLRMVADSAWVSTLSESAAKRKSDDEVLRVTNFLVDNYHTTPFESVTLTFSFSPATDNDWNEYEKISSKWLRVSSDSESIHITTDLFNFAKIMLDRVGLDGLGDNPFWKALSHAEPVLAAVVSRFCRQPAYSDPGINYEEMLGDGIKDIRVELISYHDSGVAHTSRATWRIACPLSVSVQLLRHRSGSFNMTSGRYRTLRQDIASIYSDIAIIADKAELSDKILESFSMAKENVSLYENNMKSLKDAKDRGAISNDEYKRAREFVRYVLPEGRITELYASFYIDDFDRYMMLRDSKHAQIEHGYLAHRMKKTLDEYILKNS